MSREDKAFYLSNAPKKFSIVPVERVREGSILVTDGGFTCMRDHETKVVKRDNRGELYVDCDDGFHGLDGQACGAGEHAVDFDHYIGFWIKGEEPAL